MGNILFSRGAIRHCPESKSIVEAYWADMKRRQIPTTWPESDLIHQASLHYRGNPITLIMFAPLSQREYGDQEGRSIYVAGAFTEPSWRRCGLYTDLVSIMVNEWRKEAKYQWLRGGFHLSNHVSREMQLKQGREFYEINGDHQRTRLSLIPTGQEYEFTNETLRPILEKLDRLAVDPLSRYAN